MNETTALAQRAAIQAFDVTSPDRSVTWRIERAGRISRSADSGSRWEVVSEGLGMNMVAGTSPSAEVCWIVGRAGLVLLAIDGRRFTRLPFPEITDLAAVQAADGRTAQVTALGGRTFRTTDGGQTWVEARPQDF